MQIYNEKIRDLLNRDTLEQTQAKTAIKHDAKGFTSVANTTVLRVDNAEQVEDFRDCPVSYSEGN